MKKPRAPRPIATHVMIRDGVVDWDGVALCATCGHRSDHRVHDLREVTEVEKALDARRLGEGK